MIDIVRDFDAKRLNAIVNDPEVKSWVAPEGSPDLDFSAVVADRANVALMCDLGGMLFVQVVPGTFELHTQFVRKGTPIVPKFAKLALRWMFTRTEMVELFTRVPSDNVRAARLTEYFGATKQYQGPGMGPKGLGQVAIYRMTLWDWIVSDASYLADRAPGNLPPDANVGAAREMLDNDQVDKGMRLYERWAVVAGFPPYLLAKAA